MSRINSLICALLFAAVFFASVWIPSDNLFVKLVLGGQGKGKVEKPNDNTRWPSREEIRQQIVQHGLIDSVASLTEEVVKLREEVQKVKKAQLVDVKFLDELEMKLGLEKKFIPDEKLAVKLVGLGTGDRIEVFLVGSAHKNSVFFTIMEKTKMLKPLTVTKTLSSNKSARDGTCLVSLMFLKLLTLGQSNSWSSWKQTGTRMAWCI